MKNKIVVLMSIMTMLFIFNQACAADSLTISSNTISILTILKKAVNDVSVNIVNNAYKLLYIFATINTVLIGMKQLFNGANFQSFILEMVKFLMLVSFFTFILMQGPTVFIDASQEFIGIATGKSFTVETFIPAMLVKMDVFFGVVLAICKDITFYNLQVRLVLAALCAFATAMVILAIAINMLMTLVRAWFVLTAGMFAVGFGGLSFTNQYAINYLKAFLSYGVQFMSLAFIGTIVMNICDQIATSIGWDPIAYSFKTDGTKTLDFVDCANMLFTMLIMFFSAFAVPKAVSAVFEGGSQATNTLSAMAVTSMVAKTMMATDKAGSQAVKAAAGAVTGGAAAVAAGVAAAGKLASNFVKGQQTDIETGSGDGNSGSSGKGSGDSNPIRDKSRE